MNNTESSSGHEVYVNPNADRMRKLMGLAVVLLVLLGGMAGLAYKSSRSGEATSPTHIYWYSNASPEDMTFIDFLGSSHEEMEATTGLYLANTLWKDRLTVYTDHEELRPYALQLVRQTVLLVASDVPLEAPLDEVFADLIAKPEIRPLLEP